MAVFSRIKTWVSNEVLTASDLNAEFNNLLNNTKPESIEDYSADVATMQTTADPGGVGTESLPTTLSGELSRLRYAIKRIVGGAQWYSTPDFDLTGTLGTSNLADSSVTTAKIADANVTRAKLAALGQQVSATVTFNTSSATYVDVTGLTVTITTTGRPVEILLIGDGAAGTFSDVTNSGGSGQYKIFRDATAVTEGVFVNTNPPGVINHKDTPGAGTYVYKIQTLTNGGGFSNFIRVKLWVNEIG